MTNELIVCMRVDGGERVRSCRALGASAGNVEEAHVARQNYGIGIAWKYRPVGFGRWTTRGDLGGTQTSILLRLFHAGIFWHQEEAFRVDDDIVGAGRITFSFPLAVFIGGEVGKRREDVLSRGAGSVGAKATSRC
ncbi:hypothetical protein ANO11243_068630 [Dothideomycetidae sp. 11243]|nr:hypothetical protein ANO11243_068630 [fungal sp. No.11243]